MDIACVVSISVKSPRAHSSAVVTGTMYTPMIELMSAMEPANMKQQLARMSHA